MTDEITQTTEPIVDTIVDQAPAEAAPEVIAPEAAAIELVPTVIEAEAMFTDNPGLAAVHTVDGILHRDGVLQRMAIGE